MAVGPHCGDSLKAIFLAERDGRPGPFRVRGEMDRERCRLRRSLRCLVSIHCQAYLGPQAPHRYLLTSVRPPCSEHILPSHPFLRPRGQGGGLQWPGHPALPLVTDSRMSSHPPHADPAGLEESGPTVPSTAGTGPGLPNLSTTSPCPGSLILGGRCLQWAIRAHGLQPADFWNHQKVPVP